MKQSLHRHRCDGCLAANVDGKWLPDRADAHAMPLNGEKNLVYKYIHFLNRYRAANITCVMRP
jgi:hypothetical protein